MNNFNIMTKYERTSLLGVRMEQLSFAAPSTLTPEELQPLTSIRQIAEEELRTRKIPLKLYRRLPDKSVQVLHPRDMIIID